MDAILVISGGSDNGNATMMVIHVVIDPWFIFIFLSSCYDIYLKMILIRPRCILKVRLIHISTKSIIPSFFCTSLLWKRLSVILVDRNYCSTNQTNLVFAPGVSATRGLFLVRLTLILTWIGNYIPFKVWQWISNLIPHFTGRGVSFHCRDQS